MRKQYPLAHTVIAVSAALLLALTAGCSKSDAQGSTGTAPSIAAPKTPQASNTASKLGDLSAFRNIATDVLGMVDKDDLPAAKTRVKDLELAWDSAEAGLKPRAADDWHVLDKAIDKALAALRANAPSQADCKSAMANLLGTFDKLQGTP